jgi:hypothetical protein
MDASKEFREENCQSDARNASGHKKEWRNIPGEQENDPE